MKTLIILLSFISSISFSQKEFKWDIVDSVPKTKNQIYSDTKMFIAEYWKSAKDVIQNDDKESGIILVKGSVIEEFDFMAHYNYVYHYNVTFKMKDNKFKIVVDNVYCDNAYISGGRGTVSKLQPYELPNKSSQDKSFGMGYLPEKKAIVVVNNLKYDINQLLEAYLKQIKAPSKSSDW